MNGSVATTVGRRTSAAGVIESLASGELRLLLLISLLDGAGQRRLGALADPGTSVPEACTTFYSLGIAQVDPESEVITLVDGVASAAAECARDRGIDLADLHRACANSFASDGEALQALHHFALAGDEASVITMLHDNGEEWALHGASQTILDAVTHLSAPTQHAQAREMVMRGWAALDSGEPARARASADIAQGMLTSNPDAELQLLADLLLGYASVHLGDFSQALRIGEGALVSLKGKAKHRESQVAAAWLTVLAAHRLNRKDARELATRALAAHAAAPGAALHAVMLYRAAESINALADGRISTALSAAEASLVLADQVRPARHQFPMLAWAIRCWSLRHADRSDALAEGIEGWRTALKTHGFAMDESDLLELLAHDAIDRGDFAAARSDLIEMRRVADEERWDREGTMRLDFLEARARMRLGDHARAAALLSRVDDGEAADLLRALLLARSRPDLAAIKVSNLDPTGAIEEVEAELASAIINVHDEHRVGRHLQQALEIAQGQGLVRTLAAAPSELLLRLLAVAEATGTGFGDQLARAVKRRLEQEGSGINVALTSRELSMMRMLSMGLTVAAVAEHFRLSPDTVKSHAMHVNQKLGVRSRKEALQLLKDQGLI